jgi:hypothetical protein
MRIETLMEEQAAATGFTHRFTVDYTDLNTTAGLTKTLQLLNSLPARTLVSKAAFELETPFDGGAISAIAMDVGYDLGSGTDDPDAFLDNYEVALDATEILAGDGNGAVFATLRTGYAAQESMDLEVLFTSTTTNLDALTTGKVHIYLAVTDLRKLR